MKSQIQKLLLIGLLTWFGLVAMTTAETADADKADAENLGAAITEGKASVDVRYRFENVDQDQLSKSANGSTVRTRLGYKTKKYNGFSLFIELDDVRKIGVADYTTPSGGPLATDIGPKSVGDSVIADPLDTSLNRLNLSYSFGENIAKIGRQRIIRGNSRFIGNVGWRQHEQTYDALSFESKSVKDWTFYGAYIDQRNTITFIDIDQEALLLDAQYAGFKDAVLTAYYYDIKVDNNVAEFQNFGLRYAGKVEGFKYAVEYAKQRRSNGARPDYLAADASYKFAKVALGIGFEKLGSDASTGFGTPLATLHKFNGWADQFLATPAEGLQDLYFNASTKLNKINLKLVYHSFDADTGSKDFGDEIDLVASRKFADKYTLGAKYADYSAGDADTGKTDTQKFWLWAGLKF